MQQQTRQRQARQRKSTPLSEKRRRTRQATHRSNANTTLRHMVNHPPPFHNNRKDGAQRKARSREKRKTREHNKRTRWCSGITCVLAELRAHYPEHHNKEEEEEEDKEKRKTSNEATHPPPTAIPQPTTQQDNTTQHTHHAEIHTTTHKELTVNSRHHTLFHPTQTITAIPQSHNPVTKTQP